MSITTHRPVIGSNITVGFGYVNGDFYWSLDGSHEELFSYLRKNFTEEQIQQGAWGWVTNTATDKEPYYRVEFYSEEMGVPTNQHVVQEASEKLHAYLKDMWVETPKPGQPLPREGAARMMYHVAPQDAREAIQLEGLKPGVWASFGPPAVYLWKNIEFASSYARDMGDDPEDPYEIWMVDTSGLTLTPDPEDPKASVYSLDPIEPARLSLATRRTSGAPRVMYHVSPPENRDSILANGLSPEHDQTGMGAVYLSEEPLAAEDPEYGTLDVWRVYTQDLDVIPDETTPGFDWWMTYDHIPMKMMELLMPDDLDYIDVAAKTAEFDPEQWAGDPENWKGWQKAPEGSIPKYDIGEKVNDFYGQPGVVRSVLWDNNRKLWNYLINVYDDSGILDTVLMDEGDLQRSGPGLDTAEPGSWTLKDFGIPPEGEDFYRTSEAIEDPGYDPQEDPNTWGVGDVIAIPDEDFDPYHPTLYWYYRIIDMDDMKVVLIHTTREGQEDPFYKGVTAEISRAEWPNWVHSYLVGRLYKAEGLHQEDVSEEMADQLWPDTLPEGWEDYYRDSKFRVSAANIMYHISPPFNRQSILEHGLNYEKSDPQGRLDNTDDEPPWPRGQYLFKDYEEANLSTEDDIWEVNVEGLHFLPDPYQGLPNDHAAYSPDPIPPDRLKLIRPSAIPDMKPWWERDSNLIKEAVEWYDEESGPQRVGLPRPLWQSSPENVGTLPPGPKPWYSEDVSDSLQPDHGKLDEAWDNFLCILCGLRLDDPVYYFNPPEHPFYTEDNPFDPVDGGLHQRCAKLTESHCPHLKGQEIRTMSLDEWKQAVDNSPLRPLSSSWTTAANSDTMKTVDAAVHLNTQISNSPAAKTAVQALSSAGGQVYVVGGAVRDALMDKSPKDIDLMCSGLEAEQIKAVLAPLGILNFTGANFGVFRFRLPDQTVDDEVEIALPRTEQSTGPGHKDFNVYVDPNLPVEADLGRRDFTINAMAYNPTDGTFTDPHGGMDDLQNKRLALVHDDAFLDDPLRIVRALVATARYGFEPDPSLVAAMEEHASGINDLPGERIQMEMDKLLSAPDPVQAMTLAEQTGLLDYIAPELSSAVGFSQHNPHHDLDVWEHTMAVLKTASVLTNDPDVRLAALFHDSGKPDSFWQDPNAPEGGGGHFYKKVLDDGTTLGADHEEVGGDLVKAFMDRLRYPKKRIERVEKLVRMHMFPYFNSLKGARKFMNAAGDEKTAFDLLTLRQADASGKSTGAMNQFDTEQVDKAKELLMQVLESEDAISAKDLAINGHDLIQMGMKPGPGIGRTLNDLLERVIENPELNDRDTLLNLVG